MLSIFAQQKMLAAADGPADAPAPQPVHAQMKRKHRSKSSRSKLEKKLGDFAAELSHERRRQSVEVHTVLRAELRALEVALANGSSVTADAKVKFLAAEALRGVGGLLLNADGERFCDELGRRDYVSGEMNKNKGPFRLVLNGKASKEIEWHCKHYCGRGMMKGFSSGAEVAKEIGVNPSKLAKTFADYNRVAQTKQCPYGKKFFHNLPMDMNDNVWHVAIVMPVVHYTMGGLQINTESQVTNERGHPLAGLYAAGEVAGGIHGRNRLGGNSLLDCVVFGRVAGDTASRDLLQTAIKALRTGVRPGQDVALNRVANLNGHINPGAHVEQQASLGVGGGGRVSAPSQSFNAGGGGGGGGVSAGALTEAEVAKHNTEGDCWVIISGKVYDVTKFLPDHPGGKKAIMLFAGKDATEEFDMLHPPNVLKKYLPPEACLGPLA